MSPWDRELETMGPVLDMQSILYKHYPSPTQEDPRLERRTWSNGAALSDPKSLKRDNYVHAPNHVRDVTILVGRSRIPYTIAPESLRGSSYFSSILEKRALAKEGNKPIAVDCDEAVFQQMLHLLRYNSFDALPKLSGPEMFRLRKELSFYGIEVDVDKKSSPSPPHKSPPHHGCGLARHEHQPSTAAHTPLVDLTDLPEELRVSSSLVLVARVARADDNRGRCPCTPKDQQTHWALSFYYRHAFCIRCGNPPSVSPRFIAEMYIAAAMYYSGEQTSQTKWSVACDSTCTLKVFNGRSSCVCRSCGNGHWAVSTFHSHAFCTQCGVSADEQRLVYILLSVRYGGVHHRSPKSRREDMVTESDCKVEIGRKTPKLHSGPSPGRETPNVHHTLSPTRHFNTS